LATEKPAANEASAFVHMLRDRAARDPRSVALRVKRLGLWEETTWAGLADRVRVLAAGLTDLGVKVGDPVGIIASATPEAFALDLAIQAIGALTLPIHPYTSIADIRRPLELARVKVLLVGDLETADRLRSATELDSAPIETTVLIEGTAVRPSHNWTNLTLADLENRGRARGGSSSLDALVKERRADEAMSLHATAGTGGEPRLIRITSGNLVAAWSELFERFAPAAGDPFVVEAPISHAAGHATLLLLPLTFGATAHFPEHPGAVDEAMSDVLPAFSIALPQRWESRAAAIRAAVQQSGPIQRWAYRASMFAQRRLIARRTARGRSGLPLLAAASVGRFMVLNRILAKGGLHRLRHAAVGGRNVTTDVLDFWRSMGVPLVEFYGATEAAGLIAYQVETHAAPGTGLKPPSNMQVRIAEDGEIDIRGPGVALATGDGRGGQEGDGWIGTGDRGSLDARGVLTLSYRMSDLVTFEGQDVPVGEIERLLRNAIYIKNAAVVGRNRSALSALIDLDMPGVAAWARANGVRYGSLNSLARTPEVIGMVRGIIEATNETLSTKGMPAVKKFAVLDTTDGFEHTDVLAMTGEVRRDEVEKRYASIIDSLYENSQHPQKVRSHSEAKA
jgi:long-chain acyl-CoA synthetase